MSGSLQNVTITRQGPDAVRKIKKKSLVKMIHDMRMVKYQKDPLLWLEERFGESRKDYAWSELGEEYKGHKWDGDKDPLAKAFMDLAQGKWVGIEAATGTGKTFFLSRVVFWFLDTFENALVVTSAPKQDQLKLHLWSELTTAWFKFKKLRKDAQMMSLRLKVDGSELDQEGEDPDLSQSWHAVGFVSGVGAAEQSATKAQGFHRKHMMIILEEAPGMEEAVMTAFQNTATGEHNVILSVGNPDSEFDPLHQFCILPNVEHYRISAFDYPNVVLGHELYEGAVGQASIDRREVKYGKESALYLSRVRGISPAESADSLIKLIWVDQCIDLEVKPDTLSFNAVGVDVANSEEGDKACTAYGAQNTLLKIIEFQCPNATHLGYNLFMDSKELRKKGYDDYKIKRLEDYDIFGDCVGVDAVGVGVATVNALNDHNYSVQALQGGQWDEAIPIDKKVKPHKPMYKFVSLRAQMYWELREDLRRKKISIRLNDANMVYQLRKQLVIPKWDMRSNMIAIEKKEHIKERMAGKSPNVADAVAYWNWVRKGYRKRAGAKPLWGGFREEAD